MYFIFISLIKKNIYFMELKDEKIKNSNDKIDGKILIKFY